MLNHAADQQVMFLGMSVKRTSVREGRKAIAAKEYDLRSASLDDCLQQTVYFEEQRSESIHLVQNKKRSFYLTGCLLITTKSLWFTLQHIGLIIDLDLLQTDSVKAVSVGHYLRRRVTLQASVDNTYVKDKRIKDGLTNFYGCSIAMEWNAVQAVRMHIWLIK